jgi:hypothetical protein
MRMREGRPGGQLIVLAAGLSLWACAPEPALWALLLAYGVALALFDRILPAAPFAGAPRSVRALCALLLSLPGVFAAVRSGRALLHTEGLSDLPTLTAERLRLEALPSIAPPLVAGDRPQTFFVHARPHARVRVRFGTSAAWLASEELGEGLYRVTYDPRRDGSLRPADGPLPALLSVDGSETTRTLLAATPLAHPRWLHTSPAALLAATVSEESDELVIVSPRGLERRVQVGDGPMDCAFLDEARIVVSHRYEPALFVVDAARGAVLQRWVVGHGQGRIALSPERTRLAVAREGQRPEAVLLDVEHPSEPERIPLAVAPDWLAFGPDQDVLVIATRADARVLRFRKQAGQFRADGALALGRAAVTLTRAHDGRRVYAAVTDYRPERPGNLGNHFVQDQILTIEIEPLRVLGSLLTARRSPRQSRAGDVDRGISPMGISPTRDGGLWLAFAGSDELWRVSQAAAAPAPAIIDLADSDLHAPHGVAEFADGTLAVSSPSSGAIALLSSAGDELQLMRLAPDAAYLRAHNLQALARRLGERGFYEGTRSGISCQSCHMHADSDEAAHNLGTHRLLPTLSVRGLWGSGPYLRDGSFARLGDLDHVAQTLYRGYLRKAQQRAQTLEAYVAALPRRDRPLDRQVSDAALQRRGLRAFVRAGCPTCHAFPAFTQLGQQLARSLFPGARDELFDTPSLLSLGLSAPYLSDGRASGLRSVFDAHNRSNRHGDTRALSAPELASLYAFLETL